VTGKETLRIGMVVVAITVVSRADIYFSAYFIRYPPLSIYSMGLIALFLLSIIVFAGVRRTAAEDLYDHEEASPAALEKLPANMRTIGFLSDILPPVHVRQTYVILIYGAPRISWGFVIADKLSEEIPAIVQS
jgi:hypothetical protein